MGRPPLGQRRQVNVRLPVDLVAELDAARKVISRDAWIEKAVRLALTPAGAAAGQRTLAPKVHQHYFQRPHHTEFKNGERVRYFECSCGEVATQ